MLAPVAAVAAILAPQLAPVAAKLLAIGAAILAPVGPELLPGHGAAAQRAAVLTAFLPAPAAT